MKIVILGGGLAGISAARFFTERGGCDVTILESGPVLGGLARTWIHPNGDRFDFGPHFFHSKEPFILDTLKPEIAGGSFPVTIFAKSFVGGRLYDYPVSADNVLSLPREVAVEVIEELQRTDREAREKSRTFEEYVVALVGRTLFEMFFRAYTEKLWGLPVSEIPMSWAPARISFRRTDKRFFPDEWCVYFDRGIGELAGHLLKTAPSRRVTGVRVERIERSATGWRVVTTEGTGSFDGVFATVPITRTLEYLGARTIRPLGYRSMIVMYQEVMRKDALPADWIYFPEDRYGFTRLFERNRFAPTRPSPDRSSITIEVPCAFEDATWSMKEPDLAMMIRDQLVGTGLFAGPELGAWEFIRSRYVYPVHDHKSAEGIGDNLQALREFPGIVSAGRLGCFRYMNMDETLLQAWGAAEQALRDWSGRSS